MRNTVATDTPLHAQEQVATALARRRRRAPGGFSTLDEAPLILTIEEIAAIYRCGISTIRKRVAERRFRPAPFAMRPLRWKKADVIDDLGSRKLRASDRPRRRRRRSSS